MRMRRSWKSDGVRCLGGDAHDRGHVLGYGGECGAAARLCPRSLEEVLGAENGGLVP